MSQVKTFCLKLKTFCLKTRLNLRHDSTPKPSPYYLEMVASWEERVIIALKIPDWLPSYSIIKWHTLLLQQDFLHI